MKKIFLLVVVMLAVTTQTFAFLYEVKILNKEELQKLTNEQLIESFKNAVIERKASESFHGKAGYTPKEYDNFKSLLGLIINLREEMVRRELEPPPIEEWLR